jgi:hypothetical protein
VEYGASLTSYKFDIPQLMPDIPVPPADTFSVEFLLSSVSLLYCAAEGHDSHLYSAGTSLNLSPCVGQKLVGRTDDAIAQ